MTVSILETVINRGKRGKVNEQQIDFYNLDAITQRNRLTQISIRK